MDFDDDGLDSNDEGGEDWLLSYADMMTLIACFFILMMAFANYDPVGFNQKANDLSKYFKQDKIKSPESPLELQYILEELTKHDELRKRTKISLKEGELIIKFSGNLLYKNAQSRMDTKNSQVLDSMIELIKAQVPNGRILIEGHSDDKLPKGQNQWQLSLKRAAEVARRFEFLGFKTDQISAVARSNGLKTIKSVDAKGKWIEEKAAMNRRVVIRILEPRKVQKIKLGFGTYFKDSREDPDNQKLDSEDLKGFEINNE